MPLTTYGDQNVLNTLFQRGAFYPATYRSSGGIAQASGTTLVMNAPSGINNNDLLVAFFGAGNPGTITAPTGWTQQGPVATAASGQDNQYCYTKTATSSEPSTYTWTSANSGQLNTGVVLDYGASVVDAIGTASNNSTVSTSIIASSVTTTVANTTIVFAYQNNAIGDLSITLPGALTSRANNSSTSGQAPLAVGDMTQASAGASSTETATVTSDGYWTALTLALKPSGSIGAPFTWYVGLLQCTGPWAPSTVYTTNQYVGLLCYLNY